MNKLLRLGGPLRPFAYRPASSQYLVSTRSLSSTEGGSGDDGNEARMDIARAEKVCLLTLRDSDICIHVEVRVPMGLDHPFRGE